MAKYRLWFSYLNSLLLIGLFSYTIVFPARNAELIQTNGMHIFIAEILSICVNFSLPRRSSEWKWSIRYDWHSLLIPLGICLFSILFFASSGRLLAGLIFALSSMNTIFDKKSYEVDKFKKWGPINNPLAIFFATLIPTVILAPKIAQTIPFPKSLLPQTETNTIFITFPQALLVWGIAYYSISLILQVKADKRSDGM